MQSDNELKIYYWSIYLLLCNFASVGIVISIVAFISIRASEFDSRFTVRGPARIWCARAQEKKHRPGKKHPQMVRAAHQKETSRAWSAESIKLAQSCPMFLFGAHVFIWCAAQSLPFCAPEKTLATFGPRQLVRAQDSKLRIKFRCPNVSNSALPTAFAIT